MARYRTSVRTEMSPAEVFGFVGDIRNLEKWDPGVASSIQVAGNGPEVGAAYDVTVDYSGRTATLRYEITEMAAPRLLRMVGSNARLTSIDVIEVEPAGQGSIVTYDATLRLHGLLSLADPLLKLAFKRIGDKAAAGLERSLAGEIVGQ